MISLCIRAPPARAHLSSTFAAFLSSLLFIVCFTFPPLSPPVSVKAARLPRVWQSRINGDLIKDYSSTKIKINLTPAAEEKNKRVQGERRGEGGDDVEAVCSSTSRPTALIIRWRQMEGKREKESERERKKKEKERERELKRLWVMEQRRKGEIGTTQRERRGGGGHTRTRTYV